MMIINENNVNEMVSRFLDGCTTNEEENALYEFFSSDNVPYRLRKHKAMFQWYSEGMKEPKRETSTSVMKTLFAKIGIAASLLLLFCLGLHLQKRIYMKEKCEEYAGSYIVRDGVKITDIKQILPEIERSANEAMKIQHDIDNGTYKLETEKIPVI